MELSVMARRHVSGLAVVVASVASVLLSACHDRGPLAPGAPDAPRTYAAVAVACEVEPSSGTAACGAPTAPTFAMSPGAAARSASLAAPPGVPRVDPAGDGAPRTADAIIGGQGSRIQVSLGLDADTDARTVRLSATVRNLLSQAIGSTDGYNADSGGVKLVFDAGPTVVAPASYVPQPPDTVRVLNAAVGTFTGGRPQWWVPVVAYWPAYAQFVRPGSDGYASLRLQFPAGATRVAFRLLVVAAVPDESDAGLTPDPRGWEQVAFGESHACGLRYGGAVYCWGDNAAGQLGISGEAQGYGGISYDRTRALAVGDGFSCRVTTTFVLKCAGLNTTGQLFGPYPGGVRYEYEGSDTIPGVRNVATGRWHACAVMGTPEPTGVRCAGDNSRYQLGESVSATPLPSGWLPDTLVAGVDFTCGLRRSDGSVRCWGRNDLGQVDASPGSDVPSSGAVLLPLTNVIGIAAGDAFACALVSGGAVHCWGDNRAGQRPGCGPTFCEVLGGDASRTIIAAGAEHACVAEATTVRCWGNDDGDQLGGPMSGNTTFRETVFSDGNITALALGRAHTCAGVVMATRCWGDRRLGALGGSGGEGGTQGPVAVQALGPTSALVSRGTRTCGYSGGDAWTCWGALWPEGARFTPTGVDGSARHVRVAAGRHHTCAIRADSIAVCWGEGGRGALGTGDETDRSFPYPVQGGRKFVEIAAGDRFTCALEAETDDLYCWGDNRNGQLATGSSGGFAMSPTLAEYSPQLNGPAVLYAGAAHACVKSGYRGQPGYLWCWGRNRSGQLGWGDTADYPAILENPVMSSVLDVALGNRHSCVIATSFPTIRTSMRARRGAAAAPGAAGASSAVRYGGSADAFCAGANDLGQLGRPEAGEIGAYFALVPQPDAVSRDSWGSFTSVAAGAVHTCATTAAGVLWCWGSAGAGRLLDFLGSPTDRPSLPRYSLGGDDFRTATLTSAPFGDRLCYTLRGRSSPTCWGGDNRDLVIGSGAGSFYQMGVPLP